ncbi:TspO/MBR family protein [Paludicola sp. MB14-C6]|uniref:TspO/MBR family protein n=1 Tax=Paludihabitans sp. MB14-C6 TaxID=3070656 RepID=UPI0027DE1D41|nr:TspO/MBR family protein [Paludicola sp. MB14-C6]WMJ21925.1 TspO/MBR family protein [Paludicola sp. MB14-C6]
MKKSAIIQFKPLIISILIPLAVGGLSGFLTKNSMELFKNLNQPPLAPPPILFPIVWTILFILMGISAYLVWVSDSPYKKPALLLYGVQLFFNFMWSIIFFNWEMRLFAFIWLMILWLLIIIMIALFYKVDKRAAYLQIPYLLWVTFAAYLNFAIYILN